MATKVRNLSALIENQLPEFISSEYPKFSAFLQKYYEQLELPGQPLDLINNLLDYRDIDTYEKRILKESTSLSANITDIDTIIPVEDTSSFPDVNGYIKIGDEIIFYKEKTQSSFIDCYRNVSGTTKIGDLYEKSEFVAVSYSELNNGSNHGINDDVINISNLFLYALVKNFESEYLNSFPEKNLRPEVDKSVLIKNIKEFYSAKGTDQSIRFIFNSIVATESDDIPTVYYPKENTFKGSNGEWIDKYALKVKVLYGDITKIIGEKISQSETIFDPNIKNAFGIIDNLVDIGDDFYELILAEDTVVGEFAVAAETFLTKPLYSTSGFGKKINVYSTSGWDFTTGTILIENEVIQFEEKNVNQFTINSRGTVPSTYDVDTPVYTNSTVTVSYVDDYGNTQKVGILILGILYSLTPSSSSPYSSVEDIVQVSKSGFDTRNKIVYDLQNEQVRWRINTNHTPPNTSITTTLSETIADVSAIYEDEQYFYVASSGFPTHDFGVGSWNSNLKDQKKLKLIRKFPSKTTEIYKTTTNEVGILVNGVSVRSYKDDEEVVFGEITNVNLTNPGSGYVNPPKVLILNISKEEVAQAKAVLNGEVIERIDILESGSGFFPPVPYIEITSGRNAIIEAVVTVDKVTNLKIIDAGEYYTSSPRVIIRDKLGKGRFASYKAVVSTDGKITGFIKEDEGKFYTQQNIEVIIEPVGGGATAESIVRTWRKNKFKKYESELDNSYGYFFQNNNPALEDGYSYLANPKGLRIQLNDNLDIIGNVPVNPEHSPILGYAYDGNPIYGPYGYLEPSDSQSNISRMRSSYVLRQTRPLGPSIITYPLGTFVEDYKYTHRSGDLDQNNGRFCVTPEYPEGTYAYFVTIDVANNPVFPYVLGENYYTIPVDANYNKNISQNDLPKNIKRLRTSETKENGDNIFAFIDNVKSGSVSDITTEYSPNTFSCGSVVDVDYSESQGSGILARVSSIKGKTVSSIQSQETKAVKIVTDNPAYFFSGSTITQQNTNATGILIGDVFDDKTLVLENVQGTFDKTSSLFSTIPVINIITNSPSTFTANKEIVLTTGNQIVLIKVENNTIFVASNTFKNGDPISFTNSFSGIVQNQIYYVVSSAPTNFKISNTLNGAPLTLSNNTSPGAVASSEKARGLILQGTELKNTLKIKVLQGTFDNTSGYFLRSFALSDSVGVTISTTLNLSSGIIPLSVNDNIAIVETNQNHNISVNDKVTIDINPDDSVSTTDIYVRKRIYQKVLLNPPSYSKQIVDTGIGRLITLNSGADYANSSSGNQTFTNVELIFADQTKCRDEFGNNVGNSNLAIIGKSGNENNAKATVITTGGLVSSVTITSKGKNYKKGDILTIVPSDLDRNNSSTSTRFFIAEVDHVGFATQETKLYLNSTIYISNNDLLKIGKEIVKVVSINQNERYVNVLRAQNNTNAVDHFDSQLVDSFEESFNFNPNYQIGASVGDAYILSYDKTTQTIVLVYNVNRQLSTINTVFSGKTFFDQSTPQKLVTVKDNLEIASYKFEFSYDNINWERNPIIEIQKYYKYKFITSSQTLSGSFLEFSPSGNYNIITTETEKSIALPGSANSYTIVKIGFGPALAENQYDTKFTVDFNNYFYYDKNNIIDSDKSYLRLIEDPLQGEKTVTYVTPQKFVYEMGTTYPSYDGSGIISYTTNSLLATGNIDKISIYNQGKEMTKLPKVLGIRPAPENECIVDVNWSLVSKNIVSLPILFAGKNYSKPKVVLLDTDGTGASFEIIKNTDGSISGIVTKNRGSGYNNKPTVKVIETDVKCYFSSKNIGIANSVNLSVNGKNFNRDESIFKQFTSPQILVLKNISDNGYFVEGERIEQYNGNSISYGYIALGGYRENTNILKLVNVEGEFKPELQIIGKLGNKTAIVAKTFQTIFDANVKSYYDNQGYYASDRSRIGSESQKLADSYLHQDYSYVIKSKTPINVWRDLIKNTIHPSGFKLFGEVSIESSSSVRINPVQRGEERISLIQLWDPVVNKITIENTHRTITQSTINVSNTNIERGRGSVFTPAYDTGETSALEFYLYPEFNGYFNENGNIEGNKTFTIKLTGSNNAYFIDNPNNIFITIDGVLQEPNKAFTVSGTQITFAQPPLGTRNISGNSISQSSYIDGLDVPAQKAVCRIIKLKDATLNNQYFRKIKDISNSFNGVDTSFALYYEDDSDVILDSNENLLVAIDGVLQQSGSTPLIPLDRSYYIRRTVVPNEIVFLEPPRKFVSFKQSFFAYSIGGFERLSINSVFVDGIKKGPFLLRSVITEKTVGVDDDRNVLVFLDGILQKRNRDYILRGTSITFTEAIRSGQKLNVLYLYGRDYQKSLTAFNYERVKYINRFVITVSGRVLQNISDGVAISSSSAYGVVKRTFFDGTNTEITVDSQNPRFNLLEDLTFTPLDGESFIIPFSDILSVQDFPEDDDTEEQILEKSVPGWLIGYTNALLKPNNFIRIGDLIKVDGETSFRKITSISETAKKLNYRPNDDTNEGYYGKLGTTNYSEVSRGEGLSIVADIENGKVVSLTWNKKDWDSYVTKKIYPSVPGYGYETAPQIIFIPQALRDEGGSITDAPQGGGAKAYVIVDNGEVLDVILYDQGSGYLTPPKVVVTRNYDLIRSNRNIETSLIKIGFESQLDNSNLLVSSGSFNSEPVPPIVVISTFVVVTPFNTDRYITSTVKRILSVSQSNQASRQFVTTISPAVADITSLSAKSTIVQRRIETPIAIVESQNKVTIINTPKEITSTLRVFAKVDYLTAYKTLYETGAYLDSVLTTTSKTAFVPNTTKFASSGKLLIEDEIVSYTSKLSDRFINLSRGLYGTTAKEHLPGAFLRQYNENITIVDAGIKGTVTVTVESTSVSVATASSNIISQIQDVLTPSVENISQEILSTKVNKSENAIVTLVSAGVSRDIINYCSISFSVLSQSVNAKITATSQISTTAVTIVSLSDEILTERKYGTYDRHVESIFLTDTVLTRTGSVTLSSPINQVQQRSGIISVNNRSSNDVSLNSYSITNVGNNLNVYNSWYNMDTGVCTVSALTFDDMISIGIGTKFTLKDFENTTSYAISLNYWNYGYSSINEFGALLTNDMTNISTSITILNTSSFPSSGKLLIGDEVVTYTGKTSTSFTGVVRGQNAQSHLTGDYLRTLN